eukprot:TRINITY_DN46779_c0_g1_i1.p1 TRINITY_DN46779_c0_g1~~TRINITY_DN46779_c0_g1_i1.p1  ORF type:complete len:344 (+),score=80.14 TRINITY_DN46779_c0_g1_i1:94-1032(+)
MGRREPTLTLVRAGSGTGAVWDWPAAGTAGATAVLLHATGHHSRCLDCVVRRLPPAVRCLCVDMPGHGRSSPPEQYEWRAVGPFVTETLSGYGFDIGRADVIMGHSHGGYAALHVAALLLQQGRRPPALILVDPVLHQRQLYCATSPERAARSARLRETVLRRKAEFASADEMYERFAKRDPFSLWRPEALRAYCDFGLSDPPAGGGPRQLLCSPRLEADVYAGGLVPGTDLSEYFPALKAACGPRITVLRAKDQLPSEPPFAGSPTRPDLAELLGARDVQRADVGHFVPQTHPELVAELIMRAAGQPRPAL